MKLHVTHRNGNRYWRSSALALAAMGVLLSLGTQDSCNTANNVGLAPDTYDNAASPPIKESSFKNPVIVTRDNPWMAGAIATTANGVQSIQGGGLYNHASQWEHLRGSVNLRENRSDGSLHAVYDAPILPAQTRTAPAFHGWATRGFDLVHGNTYNARLLGFMGDPLSQFITPLDIINPLTMKLSDNVQLVPVVVISLLQGPNDDSTFRAKALFDFIPYHSPPYQPSQLSYEDVLMPNTNTQILDPFEYEIPPDNIWHQCRVQTQVLASFAFDMGTEWQPLCSISTGLFMSQIEIESRLSAMGPFGQYIVGTLQPIYVVYSSACQSLLGALGNSEFPSLVEVVYPKTLGKPITAHEIGHILLGPQHSQDNNNLMRVNPAVEGTTLDEEQCEQAWNTAAGFSDRYREFNIDWGRALFEPFDSFGLKGDDPTIINNGPIDTVEQLLPVCCEYEDGHVMLSSHDCTVSFGRAVDDSECMVCCADTFVQKGGFPAVSIKPVGSCDSIVMDTWCDQICCSEYPGGIEVTRWHCDHVGGVEVSCPLN